MSKTCKGCAHLLRNGSCDYGSKCRNGERYETETQQAQRLRDEDDERELDRRCRGHSYPTYSYHTYWKNPDDDPADEAVDNDQRRPGRFTLYDEKKAKRKGKL